MKTIIFLALALSLSVIEPVKAQAADHDSRPLTADEKNIFKPLACVAATNPKDGRDCSSLIQYPEYRTDAAGDTLGLDSIAYGSFTAPEKEEAYVSYSSSNEPHATNFGGGILFEHQTTGWKLIKWFPGGQSVGCLGMPAGDIQKLFCLYKHIGQGEIESSLYFNTMNLKDNADFYSPVLKAEDTTDTVFNKPYQYICHLRKDKDRSLLLQIENIKISSDPQYFAEAKIKYLDAKIFNEVCRKKPKKVVLPQEMIIHFAVKGQTLEMIPANKFSSTDY